MPVTPLVGQTSRDSLPSLSVKSRDSSRQVRLTSGEMSTTVHDRDLPCRRQAPSKAHACHPTTPTAVREVSTVAVAACSQNCVLPSNGTSTQFQQRHRQQLPPSQVQSHPKCKISPHHRPLKSQMAAWYQIYLFAFLQHPT